MAMNSGEDIQVLHREQKQFFESGHTKDIDFRMQQLTHLKNCLKHSEREIIQALKADLNKSELDSYATEVGFIYEEINQMVKHLRGWAKPKRVKTPMTHLGAKSYIYSEPYGLTLIISPWNYPFHLALAPLIGALAAGNCAILKPSELSPAVSEVLDRIISANFPKHYLAVVQGGVEVSQTLLEQQFDYIFFTGSIGVGRIVMEAAAKNLTPVTLELGGKSPCIVHEDANLDLAAKRIVWGKYLNAGQTCIAPDYLLVHQRIKDSLINKMREVITDLFGPNVINNEDYTKIINQRHFERLVSYIKDVRILSGGTYDDTRRLIEPTIIDQVTWDHPVMQDEIFGPIFPVLEYEGITEVIDTVNAKPKPLALYFFSESPKLQELVIERISYGGGCINDTIMHIANPHLPFGGVGTSGMGSYHGKMSFALFSHKKSVLKQTTLFDLPVRYPSYKHALRLMKYFIR